MNLQGFSDRLQKAKESPTKAHRPWQDKDNPYSAPNIIKRYGIKPPQSFRIWALAKKNSGYMETVVKGFEDGLKLNMSECGGLLISKLFPKKK